MARVLTDLYSILRLREDDARNEMSTERMGHDSLSLLQSLVISESVILDGRRAPEWHLSEFCAKFGDVFRLEDLGDLWDSNTMESIRAESGAPNEDPFLLGGLAYLKVAQQLGVYLLVHPSRSRFLNRFGNSTAKSPIAEVIVGEFEKHLAETAATPYAAVDFSVPPVAERILWLRKTHGIDVATAVNELRNSKHARRFRKYAADLDSELWALSPRASIAPLQRMVREVHEVARVWSEDLDADVHHVERRVSLRKLWGLGPILESLGIDGFTVKDPVLFAKNPHLLFLNDLYRPPDE